MAEVMDEPWRESRFSKWQSRRYLTQSADIKIVATIEEAESAIIELSSERIDAASSRDGERTAEAYTSYYLKAEMIIESMLECIDISVPTVRNRHGHHTHHLDVLAALQDLNNALRIFLGHGDVLDFLNSARLYRNRYKRQVFNGVATRDSSLRTFVSGIEPRKLEDALRAALDCVNEDAGLIYNGQALYQGWMDQELPSDTIKTRMLFHNIRKEARLYKSLMENADLHSEIATLEQEKDATIAELRESLTCTKISLKDAEMARDLAVQQKVDIASNLAIVDQNLEIVTRERDALLAGRNPLRKQLQLLFQHGQVVGLVLIRHPISRASGNRWFEDNREYGPVEWTKAHSQPGQLGNVWVEGVEFQPTVWRKIMP